MAVFTVFLLWTEQKYLYGALKLKALHQWYSNYLTSAQWSNKHSSKWTNSPRAWKVLLHLGCCHVVKGHLGVEYSTAGRPFLHRVPEARALLANPFTPLTKAWAARKLAERGIHTNRGAFSDSGTLVWFINTLKYKSEGKQNRIPSSHLQERNKTVPHPSADNSSLITTVLWDQRGTGLTRPLKSPFQLPP